MMHAKSKNPFLSLIISVDRSASKATALINHFLILDKQFYNGATYCPTYSIYGFVSLRAVYYVFYS